MRPPTCIDRALEDGDVQGGQPPTVMAIHKLDMPAIDIVDAGDASHRHLHISLMRAQER